MSKENETNSWRKEKNENGIYIYLPVNISTGRKVEVGWRERAL